MKFGHQRQGYKRDRRVGWSLVKISIGAISVIVETDGSFAALVFTVPVIKQYCTLYTLHIPMQGRVVDVGLEVRKDFMDRNRLEF